MTGMGRMADESDDNLATDLSSCCCWCTMSHSDLPAAAVVRDFCCFKNPLILSACGVTLKSETPFALQGTAIQYRHYPYV